MKARIPRTTRRRTARLSAAAAERIGGIAHDLNNIFAPILMAVSLLKPRATDPRGARLVELLGEHARRGVGLVRQLEAFGQAGRAGPVPARRPAPRPGGGRRR